MRLSVRIKFHLLTLPIYLFAIGLVFWGVRQVDDLSDQVYATSSAAYESQAVFFLQKMVEERTHSIESDFNATGRIATRISRHTQSLFSDPPPVPIVDTVPVLRQQDNGVFANTSSSPTSVFIPAGHPLDPDAAFDVNRSEYLNILLPAMQYEQDIQAVYLGTESQVTRYFPNISLGEVLPPDFLVTGRPWYEQAAPARNPARETIWTAPYDDATGKGKLLTVAAPVYVGETFRGVVGVDLDITRLLTLLKDERLLSHGFFFILDADRNLIAFPESIEKEWFTGNTLIDQPFIDLMFAKEAGWQTLELHGQRHYLAFHAMQQSGWRMGAIIGTAEIETALAQTRGQIDKATRGLIRVLYVSASLLFLLFLVLGFGLSRYILRPLSQLNRTSARIAAGDYPEATVDIDSNDEAGDLAKTFNQMVASLRRYRQEKETLEAEQEKTIKERTDELEAKNRELEATLEDFYTMRLTMQEQMKSGTVERENRKMKERLDALKGNGNDLV